MSLLCHSWRNRKLISIKWVNQPSGKWVNQPSGKWVNQRMDCRMATGRRQIAFGGGCRGGRQSERHGALAIQKDVIPTLKAAMAAGV
jgi:hypothetical protein